MTSRTRLLRLSESLNRILEWVSLSILGLLTVLTFSGIIARYIFGSPIVWLYETTLVLFSWMIFLGVSVAFNRGEHIHLELFHHRLSPKTQDMLRSISHIIVIIFLLIVIKDGLVVIESTWDQQYNTISLSTAWFYIPFPFCALITLFEFLAQFLNRKELAEKTEEV